LVEEVEKLGADAERRLFANPKGLAEAGGYDRPALAAEVVQLMLIRYSGWLGTRTIPVYPVLRGACQEGNCGTKPK